ncbi:Uncharacterized protein BWINRASL_02777 [Bacillus mycoides]|nr:Uncharacterized protein BWINRASL_02777 [Bacillus mycoides]
MYVFNEIHKKLQLQIGLELSPTSLGLDEGDKAHESLLLTLGMLDTVVVQNGSLLIPSVRTKFSDDTKQALISLIHSIVDEIRE